MRKRLVALLGLILVFPAKAQRPSLSEPKNATIVFDAGIREFTCWSEGELTSAKRTAPCDSALGWHPVTAALHFTRGELLTVLVIRGVANDIFSVEVTADDLAPPTTPVSGSFADLTKLQPIPALATLILGTSVKAALVPVCPSRSPTALLRGAPTVAPKDFAANLENWFIAPLSVKEVLDLLAADYSTPLKAIEKDVSDYLPIAARIQSDVNHLTTPHDFDTWVSDSKRLSIEIDRAAALRTRIVASGFPAFAKTISDAAAAAQVKNVSCALGIYADSLQQLADAVRLVVGDEPYVHIERISVAGAHFSSTSAPLNALLSRIERAAAPTVPAATQLTSLKANLNTLVDSFAAIQSASDRRAALGKVTTSLAAGRTNLDDAAEPLAVLTDSLTAKAAGIDSVGNTLSLPMPYNLLVVGQWFANKTISMTLKQGARLRQFDVGAVSDATRISLGGDQPPAKPTTTAVGDLSATRTLRFPVYDTYHVELGLGFVYSTARDDRFQVDQVTTGTGNATVTQQFIDQTRARSYTLVPTANVIVYPFPRHDFPWRARYPGEPKPGFYEDLGVMAGFGLSNPARDILLGMSWRPVASPIGLQFAWHMAFRDYPPADHDIANPLPDTTRVFILPQRRINGFAGGLYFTTDFFTKIFATIFKAAT